MNHKLSINQFFDLLLNDFQKNFKVLKYLISSYGEKITKKDESPILFSFKQTQIIEFGT